MFGPKTKTESHNGYKHDKKTLNQHWTNHDLAVFGANSLISTINFAISASMSEILCDKVCGKQHELRSGSNAWGLAFYLPKPLRIFLLSSLRLHMGSLHWIVQ